MTTPPSPTASPYRVVVVDDHAMFRTGVKAEIGTADIRSAPGEGTEVRLHIGRDHEGES